MAQNTIAPQPKQTTPDPASAADSLVARLRGIAVRSLGRMYRPEERLFAFRLRRDGDGVRLEGVSRRYTAVVLLALADEPDDTVQAVLGDQNPLDVCDGLIDALPKAEDLGEVALTLWAARALDHPRAAEALSRLRAMDPADAAYPTVEVAWALTPLVVGDDDLPDADLADAVARRLLATFEPASCLFPHWPVGARRFSLRSHVCCFADLVYPIQALSHYARRTGSTEALDVAARCADRMCSLQGPAGQWWWHYDVRTGRVIEGYPVYAVHQDSMAPMALAALRNAGGPDYASAAEKGLAWLADPPEIEGSLIDEDADVIWRKIARHEPGKSTRTLQALASRIHPGLRLPGIGSALRPRSIDFEMRPYHMGWILYAWHHPGQAQSS